MHDDELLCLHWHKLKTPFDFLNLSLLFMILFGAPQKNFVIFLKGGAKGGF